MKTNHGIASPIEKDRVGSLHFPAQDVLSAPLEIHQRRTDAITGMLLGNNYKCKVLILFKDEEGTKQVETTIWAVTDSRVILKMGMGIPLHRIIKIKI